MLPYSLSLFSWSQSVRIKGPYELKIEYLVISMFIGNNFVPFDTYKVELTVGFGGLLANVAKMQGKVEHSVRTRSYIW